MGWDSFLLISQPLYLTDSCVVCVSVIESIEVATVLAATVTRGLKSLYRIPQDLEALALLAGFTGTSILGEMHAFRARDPRTDDIGEGMSPVQVRKYLSCVSISELTS